MATKLTGNFQYIIATTRNFTFNCPRMRYFLLAELFTCPRMGMGRWPPLNAPTALAIPPVGKVCPGCFDSLKWAFFRAHLCKPNAVSEGRPLAENTRLFFRGRFEVCFC